MKGDPAPGTSTTLPPSARAFRTTRWTRVLAARGDSAEAKSALSDLCAAYYAPVVAFLRAEGREEDAARELAHEFFARVLERQSLGGADPARGRFRSYLLGALKHFLGDQRDRALTAKRGGGAAHEPLAAGTDTSPGLDVPDPKAPAAEREFDRKWALTVLDRALAALAQEHAVAGESAKFDALKPWLTGDTEKLSQAQVAAQLKMNEGAVKVAVHRLRRRFRELVKAEIAQTVGDPAQVPAEMQSLLAALA
jgi:RNA polymerase sigma factor (sigma-70 family)